MKNRKYGKGLLLAVLILAAGASYSCKDRGGELLPEAKERQGLRLEEKELSPEGKPVFRESEIWGEGKKEDPLRQEDLERGNRTLGLEDPDAEAEETSGSGRVSAETRASCFVHVCGQVEKPGVYELQEGQRVFEAVTMAGGFTEEAAENYLNLAEPVWDGMKLEVPDRKQVPATEWAPYTGQAGGTAGQNGSSSGTKGAGNVSHSKVNLNTATKEELMTLRGIGEARAEDIIRYREKRGGFERIEDIMEISGIKNAAFEKIKDDITV